MQAPLKPPVSKEHSPGWVKISQVSSRMNLPGGWGHCAVIALNTYVCVPTYVHMHVALQGSQQSQAFVHNHRFPDSSEIWMLRKKGFLLPQSQGNFDRRHPQPHGKETASVKQNTLHLLGFSLYTKPRARVTDLLWAPESGTEGVSMTRTFLVRKGVKRLICYKYTPWG